MPSAAVPLFYAWNTSLASCLSTPPLAFVVDSVASEAMRVGSK
jgi:hypothetical protein